MYCCWRIVNRSLPSYFSQMMVLNWSKQGFQVKTTTLRQSGKSSEELAGHQTTAIKTNQSSSYFLSFLSFQGQYGNARVLVRHLLTRWQDKLLMLGRFTNPKQRPPSSLGARRPRKVGLNKYWSWVSARGAKVSSNHQSCPQN